MPAEALIVAGIANLLYDLHNLQMSVMVMKIFSFSDLSRKSGDVLDAALAGPVSLMKRGKTKVVMLPVDEYQRLVDDSGARQAFSLETASGDDIKALMEGFQKIVDDAGAKAE